MADQAADSIQQESDRSEGYTVVARRYRPKSFDELVGQDTVAQGLMRAIETDRVGHAYLFTGARGVGKTTSARIFAKMLNASNDHSGHFNPESEVAKAIDAGDDMDVIEIDGASNNGVEEIRVLRSNVSVRPTRGKYKIYIIDEVHMLTNNAFNALLKTLEEPPEHVKFIFCTTEPDKLPATVLSRCQRFDFPPVKLDLIFGRLKLICEKEGIQAEEAALKMVARLAQGSMRDSQSLLEQLVSFSDGKISVDHIHTMFGMADETRLALLVECMVNRDAGKILRELDLAIAAGIDAGQLGEQLMEYLRDIMTISVGAPPDVLRTVSPGNAAELKKLGDRWGLASLMAAIQLLDEAIVKMKSSTQSRTILEITLVQSCNLADLQAISNVIQAISQGKKLAQTPSKPPIAPAEEAKKKLLSEPIDNPGIQSKDEPVEPDPPPPLDTSEDVNQAASPRDQFQQVALGLGGLVRQLGSLALDVVEHSTGSWKVLLAKEAKVAFQQFCTPENIRRLKEGIRVSSGASVELDFQVTDQPMLVQDSPAPTQQEPKEHVSQPQRIRQAMGNPVIKKFIEVFESEVVKVDESPMSNQ